MESKFDATIADLEEDIAISDEVKAKPDKVSELVYMQQRHVLQKNSNHQFVEAVKPKHKKDPDWKASLKRIARIRCRVACPTLVVEEINGIMKNKKLLKKATRVRRPQRAMGLVLQSKLFHKSHRWTPLPVECPTGPKMQFLTKQSFQPSRKKRSMNFASVVSTSQSTSWYSPKAENMIANCGDPACLKLARRWGNLSLVSCAWMGCVSNVDHCLCISVPAGAPAILLGPGARGPGARGPGGPGARGPGGSGARGPRGLRAPGRGPGAGARGLGPGARGSGARGPGCPSVRNAKMAH